MITTHTITKGRDIPLTGAAEARIVDRGLPPRVAVQPPDFRGLRFRLLKKEGEAVLRGTPVLENKDDPRVVVVAPAAGRIAAVNRGEKRALLEVVIETDSQQDGEVHDVYALKEIESLSREEAMDLLLKSGVWPCLRQRPFSCVASPSDTPKAIFVQAMNTEPLALNVEFALQGREEEFKAGLGVLRRLTPGKVHVCVGPEAVSDTLCRPEGVEVHRFLGPHPAGNVSTHIHAIDPIRKGDIVWTLRAEDVARVGHLFLKGSFSAETLIAITGEGASERFYAKTFTGAPVSFLLNGQCPDGYRYLSGSVLNGRNVGKDGFVGFYDSQITVIPEGGRREFLGWLSPGKDKFTFSKLFVSSFLPEKKEISLDTSLNGSPRAIVLNHIYDEYVPLNIMTYFLIKAILAGDIEEAERLGILECDEEDFALCSFACPSKTDVGAIIRQGLDVIQREG